MHTFFINASNNPLNMDIDILDIQKENKKFTELQCPCCNWTEDGALYVDCACQINDIINSYKSITHDYNLIMYVDLLEFPKYVELISDSNLTASQKAHITALFRALLLQCFKETILKRLDVYACKPDKFLVIFEHNKIDEALAVQAIEEEKNKYLLDMLGYPKMEEFIDLIRDIDRTDVRRGASMLFQKIADLDLESWIPDASRLFNTDIEPFLNNVVEFENADLGMEFSKLHYNILSKNDNKDGVFWTSWYTDRTAYTENVRVSSRRLFELQAFLLECVYDASVLDGDELNGNPKKIHSLKDKWDSILSILRGKRDKLEKKREDAENMADKFSEKKMMPKLKEFSHTRFGMDEFGYRNLKIVDLDDEPEDEGGKEKIDNQEETDNKDIKDKKNKKSKKDKRDKNDEQVFLQSEIKKYSKLVREESDSLLDKKLFKPFGKYEDKKSFSEVSDGTAEGYIENAKELRKYHLDYMKHLKDHISEVLANYAGKSLSNEPPILDKRKVSATEEDFPDKKRDYRYSVGDDDSTKPEILKEKADTAYKTAYDDFMEFCSGCSVEVTDIEDQYNWFVTRIHQIRKSLERMKIVSVALYIGILLMYMPFAILRWDSVVGTVVPMMNFAATLAVPVLVLTGVFCFVYNKQKQRYKKEWEKLKDISNQIIEENDKVAEKYDKLLCVYIPSLRFVYDYKVDIEFAVKCSEMANAKLNHHRQMLKERVVSIGNLLEDLGDDVYARGACDGENTNMHNDIQYTLPYCVGENNCEIYSFIDKKMLKAILN